MSKVNIMDASAILAYLQLEKGQERVEAAFDECPCLMTSVNLCEVMGKLCEKGMPPPEIQATIYDLGLIIVNFDAALAAQTAFLRVKTKSIGASLGDRACLALAELSTDSTPVVYTAEQAWTKLKWPFKIAVIR